MTHPFSSYLFSQVLLGFTGNQFIPHGHCYLWQQNIVWLHLLSDSAIAIAYYSIPLTLLYLVSKRKDLPFDWIFLLFGGFIVSCGTTHLMEIWTLWHADYWASGVLKAVTAIISVLTAVVLVNIIPRVLAIPSTAELKLANETLRDEVVQRQQAEENYRQLATTLEQRVSDRTQELEQARLAAERSEQQLRAVLDNTTAVIYVKNLEGRLTLINRHFATIFNRPEQALVGLTDYDYLPLEMAEQVRANDQRVLEQRSPIEFEETVPIQDQLRTFISVKFPLCDKEGAPYALGGISTDITDRKQAEQELEARASELSQLNQALQRTSAELAFQNQELDQFSNIVSHDLKAPLRAISNLSEWIEDDIREHLTEDTRHQMHLLRDRVHRMDSMVKGLLEYSRAGRLEGRQENVKVDQLLADIVDLLVPPPDFEIVVHGPMPILKTEKQPLNQIFMNLISNAIKHHNRADGRIEIRAKPKDNGYEFTVQDDGPGIEPKHQERIFNIFETLKATKKTENTGLGLALVKRIVNKQSGTIRLSSDVDQGAAFIFTWPAAVVQES